MKNIPRPLSRLGGFAISKALHAWMNTLECRAACYSPEAWPCAPEFRSPAIYIFWHEYISFAVWFGSRWRPAILLSQHRDAELLTTTCEFLGYEPVRGSSTRGGVKAMREMLRVAPGVSLGITPDGPTGPRRELAPGCIFLASKLQMPLILMGIGFDRPWRYTRAWDHAAIPKPGSRARLLMSSRIVIPNRLGRDGLESYRQEVQQTLTTLSNEAEAWATTNCDMQGSFPLYPETNYYSRNQFASMRPYTKSEKASTVKLFEQPQSRLVG